MNYIPDKTIDMIFCDLPYGVTARNKWDTVIPPDKLWNQYERIIKGNGIIVLFGSGMFTAKMMMSNQKLWRYNLIWEKTTPTGFLNANRQPLRAHEDIMIFYKNQPIYNPQKTNGHPRKVSTAEHKRNSVISNDYGSHKLHSYDSTERFPTSVLTFATDKQKSAIHPTQKPLELCRYIVRTYTNEGDLVLDNCCGSGTIPLAAKIENRCYIGMDNGVCENAKSKFNCKSWADISIDRLDNQELLL